MAGVLVYEADEDFLAHLLAQVNGDAAEVLLLDAAGAREDLLGVGADQLDTGFRPRPAADEERRPRVRDLERHRREGALRLVAADFVGADPVVALVFALHV